MRISYLLILFVLVFSSMPTYGQQTVFTGLRKSEKLAKYHFDNQHYKLAAEYYQAAIEKKPNDALYLQLALAYKHLNQPSKVVESYGQIKDKNLIDHEHAYHYASALFQHDKPEAASKWADQYFKHYPESVKAKNLLLSINKPLAETTDANKVIQALPYNSGYGDFAAVAYQEGFVFISKRPDQFFVKNHDMRDQHGFYKPFFINQDDESNPKARSFDIPLKNPGHIGPVAFYDNGNKMVLTANTTQKKSGKVLQLFFYEKNSSGKWGNPSTFAHNSIDYSIAHASINPEGTIMYFISDMPGGFGGTDIYFSENINGQWSKPKNMGAKVNTDGNELFPFISHENTLYFSSDGHHGYGGLDIYTKDLKKPANPVLNLGNPVNGSADDFAYFVAENAESGYFSSNRDGIDKIYNYGIKTIKIAGIIKDFAGQILEGANLEVHEEGKEKQQFRADTNGKFDFTIPLGKSYTITGTSGNKKVIYCAIADETNTYIELFANASDEQTMFVASIINKVTSAPVTYVDVKIIDQKTAEPIHYLQYDDKVIFYADKQNDIAISTYHPDYFKKEMLVNGSGYEELKFDITLLEKKPVPAKFNVFAYQESDKKPLVGAYITVYSQTSVEKFVTNDAGKIEIPGNLDEPYLILGNFLGQSTSLSGVFSLDKPVIDLVFRKSEFLKDIIVSISDSDNNPMENFSVKIVDLYQPDEVKFTKNRGLIFFGAKPGNVYEIEISKPGFVSQRIPIHADRILEQVKEVKVTMLKASEVGRVYARLYDPETNQGIASSNVSISMFSGINHELVSGENGKFSFLCSSEDMFLIFAIKDSRSASFAGSHQEYVDAKVEAIQIPMTIQKPTPQPGFTAFIVDEITNLPIKDASIKLVKSDSKASTPFQFVKGTLSSQLQPAQSYILSVEKEGYEPYQKVINGKIPNNESITLRRKPKQIEIQGVAVKLGSEIGVSGVELQVLSMADEDVNVISGKQGNFSFQVMENETFIIIGKKDNLIGYTEGIAQSGSTVIIRLDENSDDIYKEQIAISESPSNRFLDDVSIEIIRLSTGEKVKHALKNGMVEWEAIRGEKYSISASKTGYKESDLELVAGNNPVKTLKLERLPTMISFSGYVYDSLTKAPVKDAEAVITMFSGVDMKTSSDSNGNFYFLSGSGDDFILLVSSGSKQNYLCANAADLLKAGQSRLMIPLFEYHPKIILSAALLDANSGKHIDAAQVTIISSGQKIPSMLVKGRLTFKALKGQEYNISVQSPGYQEKLLTISVKGDESTLPEILLEKELPKPLEINGYTFDKLTNKKITGAELFIMTHNGDEFVSTSDSEGRFSFSVMPEDNFLVIGRKDNIAGFYTGNADEHTKSNSLVKVAMSEELITSDMKNRRANLIVIDNISGQSQIIVNVDNKMYELNHENSFAILTGNDGKAILNSSMM
ncbi:MAG: hypothetical protein ACFCUU_14070, partial [Cyclobacteriaceae bacterium]